MLENPSLHDTSQHRRILFFDAVRWEPYVAPTPTPSPTPSDRISCYGGTTGVQCVEDTNSYIRMEINQVSGGGNGDVHLRFLGLTANSPRNINVRVYAEHNENSTHSLNRVNDTLEIRRNDGHDELYNQPQWLLSDRGLTVSATGTFESAFYANNGPMPPFYYDVRVVGDLDWLLTSGNLFVRLEVWTDEVALPTATPQPTSTPIPDCLCPLDDIDNGWMYWICIEQ
jgi:hypothetical protein